MIIFIATLAMNLELYGAFIFIHIVDPILMFAYWAFFCDHSNMKKHLTVLTVLIFPVFYTILAKIIMTATTCIACFYRTHSRSIGMHYARCISFVHCNGICISLHQSFGKIKNMLIQMTAAHLHADRQQNFICTVGSFFHFGVLFGGLHEKARRSHVTIAHQRIL